MKEQQQGGVAKMKLLSLVTETAAELGRIGNIRRYRYLPALAAAVGVIGAFLIRLVQGAGSAAILRYPLDLFRLLLFGLAPPLIILLAIEAASEPVIGEVPQAREWSMSEETTMPAKVAALWLYTLKVLGLGLLTASLSVVLLSGLTSISLLDLLIAYLLSTLPLLGLTAVVSLFVVLLPHKQMTNDK